jgi:hypothetical protein
VSRRRSWKSAAYAVLGISRASRCLSLPDRVDSLLDSVENLLKALGAELGLGPAIAILQGERARVSAVIGT